MQNILSIVFFRYDQIQYDDILNSQRKQLFNARREIVFDNIYEELFLRYTETLIDEELETNTYLEQSTLEELFGSYSNNVKQKEILKKETMYQEAWITHDLRFAQSNFYEPSFLKNNRGKILLSIIDFYWTEHIERMNYIRETINWRSYGQQNPLIEYNIEAFKSFKAMFEQIRSYMLYYFINNPINY